MSIRTKIQWCHSTVNPVMGCGGCELFPTPSQILAQVDTALASLCQWQKGTSRMMFKKLINQAFSRISPTLPGHSKRLSTTNIWHLRNTFTQLVMERHGPCAGRAADLAIASAITCYAGRLHLNKALSIQNPARQANPGYAPNFEQVTRFRGRVWSMANATDLRGASNPQKPWLDGLPRLIFISDMGDSFSRNSDFEFLEEEVINPIRSSAGQRHFWLWLTKRPEKMALFGERIGGYPHNLCAMTTVTSGDTLQRIEALRRVPTSVRGLSLEPLRSPISDRELDLRGIHWLIVGGESGRRDAVHPFHLSWARQLRKSCAKAKCHFL